MLIIRLSGIHKMTMSDAKLGMTKEVMANRVLPFLIPLSIENGLTVTQVTLRQCILAEWRVPKADSVSQFSASFPCSSPLLALNPSCAPLVFLPTSIL